MSYVGTNKIGKVYLGETEIAKAYLGSTLVYQSGPTPPNPYKGFTNGIQLVDSGSIVSNPDYCTSPYIEIPEGSAYLTFDLLETSNPRIALYDSNKTYKAYWRQNSRYRTISLANYSTSRFVRFSVKIDLRGEEFLRVRDSSFNQSNIFQGPDYHTEYDKLIFGCSRGRNNNPPSESLTYANTELFYIDPSTTTITFGAAGTNSGDLLMYTDNKAYSNYYGQNANPRTVTDNRWSTTWRYVCRNFEVGQTDRIFIKNETTNTYLFKGKNVQ